MRPGDDAARIPQRRRREPGPGHVQLERIPHHPQPARHVHEPHRRVARLHGQPRQIDADAPFPGRRDLERGEAGVDVLEAPNPQATVDAPALDLERGVARGGPRGLEPQRDGAVVDAHIAEQDQRGGAMGAGGGAAGVQGPPAQPQQLLDVQPPARVLHDVDHRLSQLQLEQHHPPGREVERIVRHVGARQPSDERRVRIEQPHLGKRHSGEERAVDVSHLDRAREHASQRVLGHSRHQRPARGRAHERGQRAQEAGEQTDHGPKRDAEGAAHHQNACPTANCTTTRRQKPRGNPGRIVTSGTSERLLSALF